LREDSNSSKPFLVKPSKAVRYRYNIPREKINDYLEPGVFIDYNLDKNNYRNISISFFSDNGQLINSFKNETPDKKEISDYNMQLNKFISIKTPKVTNKKGYNRFRWNLRHQGIKNGDKTINGPHVRPGKYKVEISVDEQDIISKEFIVIKDPNADISQETLIDLEEFQLKLLDKIKQSYQLANKIKSDKSNKKITKNKLKILNLKLEMLETKEGNYMKPMLIDQLRYLYSMVTKADQILGKDAYDRYNELTIRLKKIKSL